MMQNDAAGRHQTLTANIKSKKTVKILCKERIDVYFCVRF